DAARAAVNNRKRPPGRPGIAVTNLFAGLVFDARAGGTYHAMTRTDRGKRHKVLVNSRSMGSGSERNHSFPLETFEKAVLHLLTELKPSDILPPESKPDDISDLDAELNALRIRKGLLAEELLKGDVAAIAEALRKLEAKERVLAQKVDKMRAEQTSPASGALDQAVSLVGMLDKAKDKEDVRLRLRGALRRIIDKIWILVMNRSTIRLADVQIQFSNGEWRDLFIVHKGVPAGPKPAKPRYGMWAAVSIDSATLKAKGNPGRGIVPTLADYATDDEVRRCSRKDW